MYGEVFSHNNQQKYPFEKQEYTWSVFFYFYIQKFSHLNLGIFVLL